MGGALSIALNNAGFSIDHLIGRSPTNDSYAVLPVKTEILSDLTNIRSEVIFITTGDPDISGVCSAISKYLKPETIVFHTSGVLDSTELADAKDKGCYVGSIHPLISVSDALGGSKQFKEANFCLEGDEKALAAANRIVEALGGRAFTIPTESKPLYHASAVMAAGNVVALFDMAVEMMAASGVETDISRSLLARLLQSVVFNLSTKRPEQALTGSFARADIAAVNKHLEALDRLGSKEIKEAYILLGQRSIKMVNDPHIDSKRLDLVYERLKMAKIDL